MLGIDQPDKRLIDAEIVLKYIANRTKLTEYGGNLKKFLDETMILLNKNWKEKGEEIRSQFEQFNKGINLLESIFGIHSIGKYHGENRFIKNLFDVQVYFFSQLEQPDLTKAKNSEFVEGFKDLCKHSSDFRQSLTSSTNTRKNYFTRFERFRQLISSSFNKNFPEITIPES